MENRALGKGLSALIPEKTDDEKDKKANEIKYIKTEDIIDNPLQPRAHYNEETLSELMASIKEKGVLQPIIVRPKNNGYEVIAGERRLKAVRALKIEEVPIIVKEANDQEALTIALIENIQREELNAIEEAQAFRRLIDEFHFTQETVAQAVGKDRSTISNLLRLLKLPREIQKSVFDGQISVGHARSLLSLEDSLEQKGLLEKIVNRNLSVRELENLVKEKNKKGLSVSTKKSVEKDNYLVALEEEIQKLLGTKVRIICKKKRGKIVVEYYSSDDLERILSIIKKNG